MKQGALVLMNMNMAIEVKIVAQAEGTIISGINSFTVNPLYHINPRAERVREWSRKSKNREVIRIRMS